MQGRLRLEVDKLLGRGCMLQAARLMRELDLVPFMLPHHAAYLDGWAPASTGRCGPSSASLVHTRPAGCLLQAAGAARRLSHAAGSLPLTPEQPAVVIACAARRPRGQQTQAHAVFCETLRRLDAVAQTCAAVPPGVCVAVLAAPLALKRADLEPRDAHLPAPGVVAPCSARCQHAAQSPACPAGPPAWAAWWGVRGCARARGRLSAASSPLGHVACPCWLEGPQCSAGPVTSSPASSADAAGLDDDAADETELRLQERDDQLSSLGLPVRREQLLQLSGTRSSRAAVRAALHAAGIRQSQSSSSGQPTPSPQAVRGIQPQVQGARQDSMAAESLDAAAAAAAELGARPLAEQLLGAIQAADAHAGAKALAASGADQQPASEPVELPRGQEVPAAQAPPELHGLDAAAAAAAVQQDDVSVPAAAPAAEALRPDSSLSLEAAHPLEEQPQAPFVDDSARTSPSGPAGLDVAHFYARAHACSRKVTRAGDPTKGGSIAHAGQPAGRSMHSQQATQPASPGPRVVQRLSARLWKAAMQPRTCRMRSLASSVCQLQVVEQVLVDLNLSEGAQSKAQRRIVDLLMDAFVADVVRPPSHSPSCLAAPAAAFGRRGLTLPGCLAGGAAAL